MEHSKNLGSKEEYGSSVSGWTMYIGSPVHEKHNYDNDDDDDEHGDECNKYYYGYDHNDDDDNGKSDDSMASDASSRPSHRELTWESGAQSLDRHGASTYSSKEKLHKQRMKRDERRIKVETDKPVLKAKGAANPAQTGGKVRKSNYAGKGK
ncbi:hypothetical protein Ddye_030745 [Dipteronia dyeriana]|uniref:Uncharacterized protein n=1 Tax=Dipteronia dyeriana TaxID=168575 RepID=A0AAD9THJ2_9ROSI|nr:hypothetical protein Ddye_030745 [Dipteronia dyeriana]